MGPHRCDGSPVGISDVGGKAVRIPLPRARRLTASSTQVCVCSARFSLPLVSSYKIDKPPWRAEYDVAVAERRAEKAEQRLASLQALLRHGLALPPPDMQALLAGAGAAPTALTSGHAGHVREDCREETLDDPRAFWAEEEESLLQALDSDQTLSALEEESIYKRLAQIETLRQRHEAERAAFEKRQAARRAARSAQKTADEWRELRCASLARAP